MCLSGRERAHERAAPPLPSALSVGRGQTAAPTTPPQSRSGVVVPSTAYAPARPRPAVSELAPSQKLLAPGSMTGRKSPSRSTALSSGRMVSRSCALAPPASGAVFSKFTSCSRGCGTLALAIEMYSCATSAPAGAPAAFDSVAVTVIVSQGAGRAGCTSSAL